MPDAADRRRFLLFLVKPSHYDDDGYVIQWVKSALPSNSLACLYGIARNAMETGALGPDVDIEIVAIDETNTRVRPDRIARQIRDAGGFGLVGFVGVQSNQFPRVMDLREAAAGGRAPRLHRRLPRLRLSRDAEGDAGLAEGGARPRHLAVRRRGGGAVCRRAARRRGRDAEADLQLPRRPAEPRRRDGARSCRARTSTARSA